MSKGDLLSQAGKCWEGVQKYGWRGFLLFCYKKISCENTEFICVSIDLYLLKLRYNSVNVIFCFLLLNFESKFPISLTVFVFVSHHGVEVEQFGQDVAAGQAVCLAVTVSRIAQTEKQQSHHRLHGPNVCTGQSKHTRSAQQLHARYLLSHLSVILHSMTFMFCYLSFVPLYTVS